VKPVPSDDQIHQAHLDSIRVIHVEPHSSAFPQEPTPAYLAGGLSLGMGLGMGMGMGMSMGGLATLGGLGLGIPLLEAPGASLQGLSQHDALRLLALQPFPGSFMLQPEGGAAVASAGSSGVKPSEAGGLLELADIQQIIKVAAAAPNQMGLTLPPLAKAPAYLGAHGTPGRGTLLLLTTGPFG